MRSTVDLFNFYENADPVLLEMSSVSYDNTVCDKVNAVMSVTPVNHPGQCMST